MKFEGVWHGLVCVHVSVSGGAGRVSEEYSVRPFGSSVYAGCDCEGWGGWMGVRGGTAV